MKKGELLLELRVQKEYFERFSLTMPLDKREIEADTAAAADMHAHGLWSGWMTAKAGMDPCEDG